MKVSYTFKIKTGHFVPSNGFLQIQFPSTYYTSFDYLNPTCILEDFSILAQCKINDDNIIVDLN